MIRRPNSIRSLMMSAAVLAAFALSGCNEEGASLLFSQGKANAPLSPATLAELEQKNMAKESPMLVRLFKQEAELEVWKQDRTGRYALLKTYPICRWSGELGPKIKEGDRQAPEGFYAITQGQMNPRSAYYLSFNLGFPNAFDRAWGRTGAQLMVHGDCSSRGCYAMTDEQISEIFALGRESFFGGQQAFQVQAYPFRMTPQNMAKYRNNPNYAFWKMLKRGNDHFEVTRLEPKVDVCEKKYVFDAEAPNGAPLSFSPAGKCPAYVVPQEVADAVNDKQRNDEIQTARLIASGTPVAPIKTNVDGGMNPVFVAALNSSANVGRDTQGDVAVIAPIKTPLGTIPTSVNPPRQPDLQIATTEPAGTVVADVPLPRIAPRPKEGMRTEEPSFAEKLGSLFRPAEAKPAAEAPRVASSEPTSQPEPKKSGSLFSRSTTGSAPRAADHKAAETQPKEGITAKISRKLGLRGTETAATEETPKAAPVSQVNTTGSIWPQPKPVDPAPKPAATASANGGLMAGAQPAPATSSFDSRFAGAQ